MSGAAAARARPRQERQRRGWRRGRLGGSILRLTGRGPFGSRGQARPCRRCSSWSGGVAAICSGSSSGHLTPRGRAARRPTSCSRVGVAMKSTRMSVSLGVSALLDHLAVVHDRDHRRRLVGEAEVGEHAPFEVEEAVALAEADPVDRHGRGAGHHEVEAAARGDLRERDRPAEMLHAVEPGGVELGARRHHAGLHQQEAAVDAVGRHHERHARRDHPPPQVDEAVVGRDEGEAAVAVGRQRRPPARSPPPIPRSRGSPRRSSGGSGCPAAPRRAAATKSAGG